MSNKIYWAIIGFLLGMLLGAMVLNTAKAQEDPPFGEYVQGFPIFVCDSLDSAKGIADMHRDQGLEEAQMLAKLLGAVESENHPGEPECGMIQPGAIMFERLALSYNLVNGKSVVYELSVFGVDGRKFYAPFFYEIEGQVL